MNFYKMNENSIIEYTKRYDKSEVTLYCRKCDPDIEAHQDQYTLNSDDLRALFNINKYLYVVEEEILRVEKSFLSCIHIIFTDKQF
jgi:hypothetical protein